MKKYCTLDFHLLYLYVIQAAALFFLFIAHFVSPFTYQIFKFLSTVHFFCNPTFLDIFFCQVYITTKWARSQFCVSNGVKGNLVRHFKCVMDHGVATLNINDDKRQHQYFNTYTVLKYRVIWVRGTQKLNYLHIPNFKILEYE